MKMKPAIKSPYFADILANGNYKVQGYEGEFTKAEFQKLQKLIDAEQPDSFVMWVVFKDFSIRSNKEVN